MIRAGLIFILIIDAFAMQGQSKVTKDSMSRNSYVNISAGYNHGYLYPHHPSINYFTKENINGISLIASRSFPEINRKRPPEIGMGYYFSNLGNQDVFGNVHGLYFDIGGDFFRTLSPVYIRQSTAFGMSYNTKVFDIHNNYFNRSVGSHINSFFIISLFLQAELGDNIKLFAGPSVVHMSNGNIKMPNYGLNLFTTKVGITYKLQTHKDLWPNEIIVKDEFAKNRFLIIGSGGVRQVSRSIRERFLAASLLTDYSRRVHTNQAFGAGLDLIYDPVEGRETNVTGDVIENFVPWHVGAHLSWQRIWNRFSICLQPGYKIITYSDQKSYQYNRLAIRYQLNNNILLNWSLKSHKIRADFIEFGVGYMFER